MVRRIKNNKVVRKSVAVESDEPDVPTDSEKEEDDGNDSDDESEGKVDKEKDDDNDNELGDDDSGDDESGKDDDKSGEEDNSDDDKEEEEEETVKTLRETITELDKRIEVLEMMLTKERHNRGMIEDECREMVEEMRTTRPANCRGHRRDRHGRMCWCRSRHCRHCQKKKKFFFPFF